MKCILIQLVIVAVVVPGRSSVLGQEVAWPAGFDEPMSTDRPDFTEGVRTIPPGRFQLEGGWTFTLDRSVGGRSSDHTLPEFLLRTGIAPGLELRTSWEGFSFTETVYRGVTDVGRARDFRDHDDGATDLGLGLKAELVRDHGWLPDLSLLVDFSLPTGSAGKSAGDVEPAIKLLWSVDLAERWSLGGNVNLALPVRDGARDVEPSASLALGYEVTEWMGAYVEYYGFYPARERCTHYLNGGLVFPITEHLQLDWRIGAGLNDAADDFFTGVGFAIRF